jgi:Zinc finger, C2H2 type
MYSYQCPYCEKAFTSVEFLEKHLLKKHFKEIKDEAQTEKLIILETKQKTEAEN